MARRNARISLKPGKSRAALTITHPNAAGIDIGSASHFVAVPPDRDDEPVREFPSFTADLNAMADWLKACGVDTIAMESTGVFWIPVVRAAGVPGIHRSVGQRAARQERLRAQVRRAGLPVVATTHDLRAAQRGVSPSRRRVRAALVLAPARHVAAQPGTPCPAHAEGADPDERPVGQRHLRRGRRDGSEDSARHRGG